MGLLLPDSLMYCIKPGMRVQFFFQLSWLPTEEKTLQSHGLCVPPGSSLYVDVAVESYGLPRGKTERHKSINAAGK